MPFEDEIVQKLIEMGAITALFGLCMLLIFKIVKSFGVPFVQAQMQMAEAMAGLANAVTDAKTMVCDMVGADRADHREIVITLQVLAQEIRDLREEKNNNE